MISILRTPSTFGFVKNKNEFAVSCTRMTAAGTQSYYEVTITIPATFPGSQKPSYFVIDIAGMETRLRCESIVPPADLSEAVLLRHENIAEAIKSHWGIKQLFDVSYTLNANNVVVSFCPHVVAANRIRHSAKMIFFMMTSSLIIVFICF